MAKISELPLRERAEQYRSLGRRAKEESGGATGWVSEAYAKLARQWFKLAEETEAMAEKRGDR
jgi:hypothetical protein